MEKIKERDAVEGFEAGRESRQAGSIPRIWVAVIRFRRVSNSVLRVASNLVPDDWILTIEGLGTEILAGEEGGLWVSSKKIQTDERNLMLED